MPWRQTQVLEERLKFVADWLSGEWTMSELCRGYGISRKTGYKFVERYQQHGAAGLDDRLRAPKNHPNQTPQQLVEQIVEARLKHPRWGPRKLLHLLKRHHSETKWPAVSTIGEILKREGLVKPRRRRRRTPPYTQPFVEVRRSNELWCADFKGWFRTSDGSRCDPLTVTDAASRFALLCRGLKRTRYKEVQSWFEILFKQCGLPEAIRTDNGPPFASVSVGGLSKLSVWWIKLGIRHERIDPGKPQQNGRHERFHWTLKQETAMPPRRSLLAQQRAFNRFCEEYNQERPHEALSYRTPSEVYHCSCRPYPRTLPEVQYAPRFKVRRIRRSGEIKWAGKMIYISQALVGELVGLDQLDDRYSNVHFGPVPLCAVDRSTGNRAAFREGQDESSDGN